MSTSVKVKKIAKQIDVLALVENYLIIRQAQGVAKGTLGKDRSALKLFFEQYTGSLDDTKAVQLAIMRFLAGRSQGYHNNLLKVLRGFFGYCIQEEVLSENTAAAFKYKRETPRIIQHTEETIKAFLELPDRSSFAGLRDFAFMLVILDNGCRPNELLQIKIADVDFLNSQIIVREAYAKTKQLRVLPISQRVAMYLRKLINARHPGWGKDIPVFCTYTGKRYSSHDYQERFYEYSKKFGTTITAYSLRHCFAIMFLRGGGNIFALKEIMGHARFEMTQVYLHLVRADIKNSHEQASPINRLFESKDTVRRIGKNMFLS